MLAERRSEPEIIKVSVIHWPLADVGCASREGPRIRTGRNSKPRRTPNLTSVRFVRRSKSWLTLPDQAAPFA
jgi:hypothetical protein